MLGELWGGVREDTWPATRAGLIRGERELPPTVFCGLETRAVALDGGNRLVASVGPCAGGDTESPLQKDWGPIAIPLSGELFLGLEEGLEVDGSRVELEGEVWDGGRDSGFTEFCSDLTELCK